MCLNISSQRMGLPGKRSFSDHDALISTRPLFVYKWMYPLHPSLGFPNKAETPFRKFVMEFGVRYTALEKFEFNGTHNTINGGGFHSLDATVNSNNCGWICSGDILFPAIIPPGTKFFLGDDHDVVSKSLIVYENMADLVKVWGKPLPKRKTRAAINYTTRAK